MRMVAIVNREKEKKKIKYENVLQLKKNAFSLKSIQLQNLEWDRCPILVFFLAVPGSTNTKKAFN